ncbi:PH domain-containing protein [Virgibacillus dakarensis]|nr:PH domain-containing protein [Virgibacillus dakarensis]
MQPKRMHPMKIIFSFINTLKNSFVFIIYLFVIHFRDVSTFIKLGRIVFLAFLVYRLVSLIIEWWKTTYEIKNGSIHIYSGWFTKTDNRVPLDRIQNVQLSTPFYYRIFNLTVLSLQTSATDKEASVKFEAIKKEEAKRIEQQLDSYWEGNFEHEQIVVEHEDETKEPELLQSSEVMERMENTGDRRTVHFNPTRSDLIRASFLSLSFLGLIPILATIYHEIDDVINLDEQAKGFLALLMNSWLIMGVAIVLFVIIAIAFGMIRTFLKYGKYEIASDEERIYISSGILSEKAFSIRKENVQAIQMTQTPLKKVVGLMEIRLVSAGSDDEDSEEINSLYPFLPTDKANRLIAELLPTFKIQENMNKLPQTALLMRMLRMPWVCITVTVLIFWLKPNLWYVSPILFVLTYMGRIFDYRNTRYVINGEFIQFKTGGLWSALFLTNRRKVIEVEVERSILQKRFGLASISTINRTKPVHLEQLKDIPVDASRQFISWYRDRRNEIKVECE